MTTYMLGELITQRREKNPNEGLPIWGVSKDGWIPPKQKEADTSIYNVFYRKDFVFNQEWNLIPLLLMTYVIKVYVRLFMRFFTFIELMC